jgi:hypothetical protein
MKSVTMFIDDVRSEKRSAEITTIASQYHHLHQTGRLHIHLLAIFGMKFVNGMHAKLTRNLSRIRQFRCGKSVVNLK